MICTRLGIEVNIALVLIIFPRRHFMNDNNRRKDGVVRQHVVYNTVK